IDVFGTQMPPAAGAMTGNSVGDSVVGTTFDATSGRVRLDITPLSGMVMNSVPPTSTGGGSVTLNLLSIDGRSISQFNFAGTGKTAADDAKPTNYIVNTQTLPLAGLMMNEPTRLFGFVTPFGSAPPDFQAITVVDFSAVRAELEIDWLLKGTTAPFTTLNNTQLVLDLNNPNIGAEHEIEVGPLNFDLKSFLPSPMIVPNTSSTMQLYAIGHIASHKVENFNSFADFTAALTTTLNGSTLALSMDASGSFNSTTNTFTADHIVIVVNN
ncbi:MAG TPA: hypothetical protein VET48_01515, partial [Steroidobacteraceae bacterium]|nr:hypothetical protein [Steroidobacteraceae bacterium]